MRTPQGLEQGRARGLNPNSTARFDENLEEFYSKYSYSATEIWNLDESGAQANKNGLGKVLVRKGGRKVHAVIPNEREWLTILTTINAARMWHTLDLSNKLLKLIQMFGAWNNLMEGVGKKTWLNESLYP